MISKYVVIVFLIVDSISISGCHLLHREPTEGRTDQQALAEITSISPVEKMRLVSLSYFKPDEVKRIDNETILFFIGCIRRSTSKADASDIMGLVSQTVSNVNSGSVEVIGVSDENWIQLSQSMLNSCEKSPNLTKDLQQRHQSNALKCASNVKNVRNLKIMEKYKGQLGNEKTESRLRQLLERRDEVPSR